MAMLDQKFSGPTTLVCVGGFAMTHRYGSPRQTHDLDVCDVAPSTQSAELLALAQMVEGDCGHRDSLDLNTKVTIHTTSPYRNWSGRRTLTLAISKIWPPKAISMQKHFWSAIPKSAAPIFSATSTAGTAP